jgi:peptidyl-prolyl cis-trans isomerase SurA
MDKEIQLKLAKESIIREKIKTNELLRYYTLDSSKKYLDVIVENFYKRLDLENLDDFKDYLSEYNLDINTIRSKGQIEILWNQLIGSKYKDQLNINEDILKQKIEKDKNNRIIKQYELAEIVFQTNAENDLIDKKDLIQKDIQEKGFEIAANIHSIADSSKFGGDIGWINEQQLSLEINEAINKLNINEISKPIKVPNGFLILKIKNKKQKEIKFDKKKLLEEAILFETNRQYAQFSIIYFNKIKLNSIISEQ